MSVKKCIICGEIFCTTDISDKVCSLCQKDIEKQEEQTNKKIDDIKIND